MFLLQFHKSKQATRVATLHRLNKFSSSRSAPVKFRAINKSLKHDLELNFNDIAMASTLLRRSPATSLPQQSSTRCTTILKLISPYYGTAPCRSPDPIWRPIYACKTTLIAVCFICRLANHLLISVCYLMHPLIAQFMARCAIFRKEIDESRLRIRPCCSAWCQRLRQSFKRKDGMVRESNRAALDIEIKGEYFQSMSMAAVNHSFVNAFMGLASEIWRSPSIQMRLPQISTSNSGLITKNQ